MAEFLPQFLFSCQLPVFLSSLIIQKSVNLYFELSQWLCLHSWPGREFQRFIILWVKKCYPISVLNSRSHILRLWSLVLDFLHPVGALEMSLELPLVCWKTWKHRPSLLHPHQSSFYSFDSKLLSWAIKQVIVKIKIIILRFNPKDINEILMDIGSDCTEGEWIDPLELPD